MGDEVMSIGHCPPCIGAPHPYKAICSSPSHEKN